MIHRVAVLAGTLAALASASAAAAGGPAFLGNWARGDGKTHIRVEPCGAEFCGVNTWVRPGHGEKVGDTLVVNVKPAGAERWSRPPAQSTLHNAGPCRWRAHDDRGVYVGRPGVSEHELDAPRPSDLIFPLRRPGGLAATPRARPARRRGSPPAKGRRGGRPRSRLYP